MCDISEKLIAWLDHELPREEAAAVERHLEGCSECRIAVDSYKQVSGELDAYCDETLESMSRARTNPWTAVVAAAGAAASLVVLLLVWQHPRVQPRKPSPSRGVGAASPAIVENAAFPPSRTEQGIHRTQAANLVQSKKEINSAPSENQSGLIDMEEPVIQIAIPAEEMFPPGAVPEGMRFFADVTVGPDGSAERLRLRPRLAGFERRSTQP